MDEIHGVDGIHGGDVYRNRVHMDFSVNTNPLGMPEGMEEALCAAIKKCGQYPDMRAEELYGAISSSFQIPREYLLFGNGASELFMAIVHGLRPRRTVIPVPSFYGYEYAAGAVSGEIVYYSLEETNQFLPDEGLIDILTEDVDLLFLANPNNPTGKLTDRAYLEKLLEVCREKQITVVLDECFLAFCAGARSLLPEIEKYEHLLLVGAFTKIFAIPGVRLGYLVCSNQELMEKIKRQLPEWNLSVFAQAAGAVCGNQSEFIARTAHYVRAERAFLENGLQKLGIRVYPGEANFILLRSEKPLYEGLLERGILIRDCGNFRGLSKGYYRIAIRTRAENEKLLKNMGEIM